MTRYIIVFSILMPLLGAIKGHELTFDCENIQIICSNTNFDSDDYKIGDFGTCIRFDEQLQSLIIECLKYNALKDVNKDESVCDNDSLFNLYGKKYARDMEYFSRLWCEYSGLPTHYDAHSSNGTPQKDIELLVWIEKNRQKISPEYYVWYIDYSKYFYRSCARCRSIEELDSLEPEFKQRYKQLIDTIRRQTGLKTRKKLFAM